MAALAPGKYRITLFASLGNENAGRFSRARFDDAIATAWSASGTDVSLDGRTRNPNSTVASARNCGRVEFRAAINIVVKAGSSIQKIDLIRDVVRAMGTAGAIVRNAAIEQVWFSGRPAAADTACIADITRGSFSVSRTGAAPAVRTVRPAGAAVPVSVPVDPPAPPPAPVPVPASERIASGGSTVTDATEPEARGQTQSLVSLSTITDSAASVGLPGWALGIGAALLVFGLGAGVLMVIAGASGVAAKRARG